jgi:hypothetical protein
MTALRTARNLIEGTSTCDVWHAGEIIATIEPTIRGFRVTIKTAWEGTTEDLIVIDASEDAPAIEINVLR